MHRSQPQVTVARYQIILFVHDDGLQTRYIQNQRHGQKLFVRGRLLCLSPHPVRPRPPLDKLESSAGKRGGGKRSKFRKLFIVTSPRPRVLDCMLEHQPHVPCARQRAVQNQSLKRTFTNISQRLAQILKATRFFHLYPNIRFPFYICTFNMS